MIQQLQSSTKISLGMVGRQCQCQRQSITKQLIANNRRYQVLHMQELHLQLEFKSQMDHYLVCQVDINIDKQVHGDGGGNGDDSNFDGVISSVGDGSEDDTGAEMVRGGLHIR